MSKWRVVRSAAQPSVCPPKHTLTESRALVSRGLVGAEQVELYLVEIHPGGEGALDRHPDCEHGFYVLSGIAEGLVNGEYFSLWQGDCLFIPPGVEHSIRPIGVQSVKMIVFLAPHR